MHLEIYNLLLMERKLKKILNFQGWVYFESGISWCQQDGEEERSLNQEELGLFKQGGLTKLSQTSPASTTKASFTAFWLRKQRSFAERPAMGDPLMTSLKGK